MSLSEFQVSEFPSGSLHRLSTTLLQGRQIPYANIYTIFIMIRIFICIRNKLSILILMLILWSVYQSILKIIKDKYFIVQSTQIIIK